MLNWEQKKIHQFVAGMVFLSAFFMFATELIDCISALQNEIDGYGIVPQVKGAKHEKKIVNLTAASFTSPKKIYKDGELLVRRKKGKAVFPSFAASGNIQEREKIGNQSSVFSGIDTADIFSAIKKAKSSSSVEYAQPNFQYGQYQLDINDPYREKLWGLENIGQSVNGKKGKMGADIGAPKAWDVAGEQKDIIVAVIDSGVAFNHPDLMGNMWNGENCVDWEGKELGGCQHGFDFAENDKDPLPDGIAHGTMIAGVIGAERNNRKGITGVADRIKIMALKTDFTTGSIVKAIEFAKKNGAEIVNASWGASVDSCSKFFDRALYEEIRDFPGLVVAAAGNNGKEHNGQDFFTYPADFSHATACWEGLPNLISVAATDQNDKLADFSDYGKLIDVAAPGENIVTTYTAEGDGENYAIVNGTSLAAPYVSGLAALMLSVNQENKPSTMKKIISECSQPVVSSKNISGGRIDALSSINHISASGCKMMKSFERLSVANNETDEIVKTTTAEIQLSNAEEAKFFRLSKKVKTLKTVRWKTIPGKILVRVAKKAKNQKFYLQFRDARGNTSQVFRKTFRYATP